MEVLLQLRGREEGCEGGGCRHRRMMASGGCWIYNLRDSGLQVTGALI